MLFLHVMAKFLFHGMMTRGFRYFALIKSSFNGDFLLQIKIYFFFCTFFAFPLFVDCGPKAAGRYSKS